MPCGRPATVRLPCVAYVRRAVEITEHTERARESAGSHPRLRGTTIYPICLVSRCVLCAGWSADLPMGFIIITLVLQVI